LKRPAFPTHTTHCTHRSVLRQQLPFPFVCFDLEWIADTRGNQIINAASFVDSNGSTNVFLIEDYQTTFGQKAEYALLLEIINRLANYQFSFGWYSKGFEKYNNEKCHVEGKNSDLVILDKRLRANRIRSIVGLLGVEWQL
jgi:hypothetical protein